MELQQLPLAQVGERLQLIVTRWGRHAAVDIGKKFMDDITSGIITIRYRETVEPPGVEVWVYETGKRNWTAPVDAILAVAFAKFQGRHAIWQRSSEFAQLSERLSKVFGKRIGVCQKHISGDTNDLQQGLTVAMGRAVRQALTALDWKREH